MADNTETKIAQDVADAIGAAFYDDEAEVHLRKAIAAMWKAEKCGRDRRYEINVTYHGLYSMLGLVKEPVDIKPPLVLVR